MAKTEREPSCEDCFFHKHRLCALNLGKPCTTFRPAERNLEPERQLAFVFRTERVTAAYAFPQPACSSTARGHRPLASRRRSKVAPCD